MKNKKTIKLALLHCSEKRCDECIYNRWVKDVCQKHLCRDALALVNELEQPMVKVDYEQLSLDV